MRQDSRQNAALPSVVARQEARSTAAGAENQDELTEIPQIAGWWNYVDPVFRQQNNR